jgi:hypothetical protein
MANKLLTASQVKEQYQMDRNTLLRYERNGTIAPNRPNGKGQRRYSEADIKAIRDDQAKVTPATPHYTELGVTGLRRWGGSIYEERLQQLRGRQGQVLLHEMRINDPTIAAVFFAIENTLKDANWRVKPASESEADKEAAKFIEENLADMSYSWRETLGFVLAMMEDGVSILELTYKRRLGDEPPKYCDDPATSKYNDGRIGWRKWGPRPLESLAPGNEWIFDDNGTVRGIRQQPEAYYGPTRIIPIERLLLFRTTLTGTDSPAGRPVHRSMYLPYYFTQQLQEIEGIGIERDLGGIPIVYLGDDCNLNESDPNSDYNLAKDLVTNIRADEQAGIVVPHPKMMNDGRGMLVELLSSSNSRNHNIGDVIERYDKRKTLSLLAQFIMLGMQRVGSYALSKHQGDLFSIAVHGWLQTIADVINRHAIPRLFKYNVFPGLTGLPQLVPSETNTTDLSDIATYINTLMQQDLLTPDTELERHLRQIARLPELPASATNEREQRTQPSKNVGESAMRLRRALLILQDLAKMGVNSPEMEKMVGQLMDALKQEVGDGPGTPIDVDPEAMNAMNASNVQANSGWGASSDSGTGTDNKNTAKPNEPVPQDAPKPTTKGKVERKVDKP